jgi:hypothetical protein
MQSHRTTAIALLVLGLAVLARTLDYPPGTHGVPGPALVPRLLGTALILVAFGLLRAPTGTPVAVRQPAAIAVTVALLVAYAALWSVVPFGVLTAAVLLVFLRLTGTAWRGALALALTSGALLHVVLVRVLGVRF